MGLTMESLPCAGKGMDVGEAASWHGRLKWQINLMYDELTDDSEDHHKIEVFVCLESGFRFLIFKFG